MKTGHVHTGGYHLAIQRSELLTQPHSELQNDGTEWKKPTTPEQCLLCDPLTRIPRTCQLICRGKSLSVAARGRGRGRLREIPLTDMGSLGGDRYDYHHCCGQWTPMANITFYTCNMYSSLFIIYTSTAVLKNFALIITWVQLETLQCHFCFGNGTSCPALACFLDQQLWEEHGRATLTCLLPIHRFHGWKARSILVQISITFSREFLRDYPLALSKCNHQAPAVKCST